MGLPEYDDDKFEMLVDMCSRGEITPASLKSLSFDIPFEDQIDIAIRSPYISDEDLVTYFKFLLDAIDVNFLRSGEDTLEELKERFSSMKTLPEEEKLDLFAQTFSVYLEYRIIQEFKRLHIDVPGVTPVDSYTTKFISKVNEEILGHIHSLVERNLN